MFDKKIAFIKKSQILYKKWRNSFLVSLQVKGILQELRRDTVFENNMGLILILTKSSPSFTVSQIVKTEVFF